MEADFQKADARVLVYEGGKVNDPHDPGGRTNQGITQSTFTSWLRARGQPVRDVFTMTGDERDTIYKTEYWDRVRGDEVPAGVDFVLYDAAVNSGPGQSIKWLQAALGGAYVGQADGVLGAKTLAAVQSYNDIDGLIEALAERNKANAKQD